MNGDGVKVAVVGGGPAGLMAAEVLSAQGLAVHVYDAMPSVGRKFLLAGRGGLNLTHSEPFERFASRFGERRSQIEPLLQAFGPEALREWVHGLGIQTFVGSSGRVFPTGMKAAPLLRAWVHRLRERGVSFHMRHRWLGWSGAGALPDALRFATPAGELALRPEATVLALGGASWPRLGSDGAWVPWLAACGVEVAPLAPANCGFDIGWTPYFAERFAGMPFKSVAISFTDARDRRFARKGEFVATATGIEGSLVYAASSLLRDEIAAKGSATLWLDLLPDRSAEEVRAAVLHPRGARSVASHLKSRLGLEGIKTAVLHEALTRDEMHEPEKLSETIKALQLRLVAPRPIDEAISSAGGVLFEALDDHLMSTAMPGVFCAGEMLDWEAPTGGYLLTASMASGVVAARGVLRRLGHGDPES
ncbi:MULTISPECIES: TIGR03862 family flavoprotein [unclassified Variovorax]|uniref:TIGR03862 family flavoprotein n=1 Tax=unclassified Variovorax TaxID=663243 RepID=UPI00076CBCA1|nr:MULTISPECIES: TIGR03862 family flavoprotein [unclassified Variovorax]KWT64486.1 NAD(FAD)-utilizing dehydrogenase [Variovorax sp. WDL1]PNG56359.1 Ferredoxin--NADP reductase [Variovorax sp. B4]PNG57783.1 Ferredoxin--NADP reductase [Variovorax sp. B2]VTV09780.1 putative glutamate synthase subunit beta [Variovorax sp. WDL1]